MRCAPGAPEETAAAAVGFAAVGGAGTAGLTESAAAAGSLPGGGGGGARLVGGSRSGLIAGGLAAALAQASQLSAGEEGGVASDSVEEGEPSDGAAPAPVQLVSPDGEAVLASPPGLSMMELEGDLEDEPCESGTVVPADPAPGK